MKTFSAIVGNPPFNASSDSAKTIAGTSGDTTLYKRFIDVAFKIRAEDGTVAMVTQRNGISHAIKKHNVSKLDVDTSEYWKYAAGYFIATDGDNSVTNVTADPIISKVYDLKMKRPFRHAIGGSYKTLKANGKFSETQVPNSVYGLSNTAKEGTPAVYEYIVGTVVPAGPKVVFAALESAYGYEVTDLPAYVGSACVLSFNTLADAISAALFIKHSPIVKYLRKQLGEKANGLVFRYIKDFDLLQIKTGLEIPIEFGLTQTDINLLG